MTDERERLLDILTAPYPGSDPMSVELLRADAILSAFTLTDKATQASPDIELMTNALQHSEAVLIELREACRNWAKGVGHPNNMTNDGLAWRVDRTLRLTAEALAAPPSATPKPDSMSERERGSDCCLHPHCQYDGKTSYKDFTEWAQNCCSIHECPIRAAAYSSPTPGKEGQP